MRAVARAAVVMLVAGSFAACSGGNGEGSPTTAGQPATDSPSAPAGPAKNLVIGSINALTGDLGSYGPPMNRGLEIAVKYINDNAGTIPGGMTATLETADSESKAEGAVSAARKLVGGGAACLMGPITTPESLAVLNGVTKARKMAMFPSASSVALRAEDDAKTIYRVIPPDDLQGKALAQVVKDRLGATAGKTVVFAHQNSAYGQGLLKIFTEEWKTLGGEVALSVGYAPNAPSYESEAQKITAQPYDALIVVDFPETFGKLSDALLRTGKYDSSKTYVADALALNPIPTAISPKALEGAHGVQAGAVTDTEPAKAFDKMAKEVGERGPFDGQSFDAAILCYLGAAASNSTEPGDITSKIADIANAPGTKYSYLQLADAVKALQAGEDIDYEGVSGDIQFAENGDASTGLYEEFSYTDGKYTHERNFDVK